VVVTTATPAAAVALGAIGTCILIFALILKTLRFSYETSEPTTWEQLNLMMASLNAAIVPMLMIFGLIMVLEVMKAV